MKPDFWQSKPLIGMLHLEALPGAPLASRSLDEIEALMLADAAALVGGGIRALMMENFGDVPFYAGAVPVEVVAAMTRMALAVKRNHPGVALGINVLRNDGVAAVAVAAASAADFVRVNVLTGARVTDQGVIQGIAAELLRVRARLGAAARSVAILADVAVKHSAALAGRPLADEVEDTVKRGLADAVIVSGAGTGKAVDPERLREVRRASPGTPLLVGSGASATNLKEILPHVDGIIVGTSLKRDGDPRRPVDGERVKALVGLHRGLTGARAGST